MKKLLNTGGGNNKLVSPGIKTGAANRGSSGGAADQLGQSTAFKKDLIDGGRAYNASQLGNAKALDVGKGGPGTGRQTHHCGGQGQWGSPAPGNSAPAKDILSAFGPERSKG